MGLHGGCGPGRIALDQRSEDRLALHADRLFEAVKTGMIKSIAPAAYLLKDEAEARSAIESRKSTGSVILQPD